MILRKLRLSVWNPTACRVLPKQDQAHIVPTPRYKHHKSIVSGLRLRFPVFKTPISSTRALVKTIASSIRTYLAFEELDQPQL
jgi:hypothetical protein